MLGEAAAFIRAYDDFTLICHVSPDGDTLGSALALAHGLQRLGKRAQIVCEDHVPVIYRFLPGAEGVLQPAHVPAADAVISVDCADVRRTGACMALFTAAKHTLNIDHHRTNTCYAAANYVVQSAATGELIYALLVALSVPIDQEIASCLYTAIVTDTGNFAYSETTPDTMRIVAELLESGIDLPTLNRNLLRTIPLHKIKLLGRAITKTAVYDEGRLGIAALSVGDLADCGSTAEDTEGVIDSIRDIDTVEIAALLRECGDGTVRVSLRGKRYADVSCIAQKYDGGGHRLAAGCTLRCSLAEAIVLIRSAAEAVLRGEAC